MLTNVARVMLFLEEVGAEYELVPVDFVAGEHKRPQHLQLNPFGQMPGFQDGDLVLFESRAIGKYIIRKYGTAGLDLLGENSGIEESAMVDVWTEVEDQQYYPAISPVVFECIINPFIMGGAATNQKVVDESLERLKGVLGIYEARLEKSRYLAGDSISFADLNHIPFTFYFMTTRHASVFDDYPKVKAWWESLMARPAVQRIWLQRLEFQMVSAIEQRPLEAWTHTAQHQGAPNRRFKPRLGQLAPTASSNGPRLIKSIIATLGGYTSYKLDLAEEQEEGDGFLLGSRSGWEAALLSGQIGGDMAVVRRRRRRTAPAAADLA
ncbi:glutathione S-transferase [Hordeum vulgare]|nr:glutathione S-transferase [Hordeum vulgare]